MADAPAVGTAAAASASSSAWGGVTLDGSAGAAGLGFQQGTKRGRRNTQGDQLLRTQVAALSLGNKEEPSQPPASQAKSEAKSDKAAAAKAKGNAAANVIAPKGKGKAVGSSGSASAADAVDEGSDGENDTHTHSVRSRKHERLGLLNAKQTLQSLQILKALQAQIMVMFLVPVASSLVSYIRQALHEYHSCIFNNAGKFGLADVWVWKAALMCVIAKLNDTSSFTETEQQQLQQVADHALNSTPETLQHLVSHA